MFNIGSWEMIIIVVAALLLLGPRKLPDFARWVGTALREVRKVTQEVRSAIDMEVEKAELEELKRQFDEDLNINNLLDPDVKEPEPEPDSEPLEPASTSVAMEPASTSVSVEPASVEENDPVAEVGPTVSDDPEPADASASDVPVDASQNDDVGDSQPVDTDDSSDEPSAPKTAH